MSAAAFIALQCCQCSTMQVKQRKKSNNKWTCVVCNQKQSTRQVFAQGPMARDVRNFVQNFNMSRQFSDQNRGNNETLAGPKDDIGNNEVRPSDHRKKRTDWSQYVEYEPEIRDEIEDVNEPKIVTELPKALFRKHKLSMHASRRDSKNEGNGFKPIFSKRKSIDTSRTQDKESSKNQHTTVCKASKWSVDTFEEEPRMCSCASKSRTYPGQENENDETLRIVPSQLDSTSAKVLSKWSNHMIQDNNDSLCEKQVPRPFQESGKAKRVSKWNAYVTTEDNGHTPQPEGLRDISNQTRQQLDDEGLFDVTVRGERVEEDIHPDFL